MKYLLKIVALSIIVIPMLAIDFFKGLWDFDFEDLYKLVFNYKRTIKQNWIKAFGISRPTRPTRPTRF